MLGLEYMYLQIPCFRQISDPVISNVDFFFHYCLLFFQSVHANIHNGAVIALFMDKLEKELRNYDCEVLRVDDTTGAQDVGLGIRVAQANGPADQ